ncbi:astacin-like metalloendopeptidase isoform X2 [Paramacrobiotus metropolitanus]|uniref:astacin-like metalloendopeptidase isoform X2 n=1 Tax=Paramacrobiotus metropolitanus TaxID=2943436 RepID=UPI0024458561|nr:astacin-like metalloendopeptidase isoform X2 [Paramacrobiotus metropolitanus]
MALWVSAKFLALYLIFPIKILKQGVFVRGSHQLDTGSTHGLWNKNAVPYYLDPVYNETEASIIRRAIYNVMHQMNYCVTFVEVSLSSPTYKVHITPLTGNSRNSPPHALCFTSPGIDPQTKATSEEQILSVARGSQGCLDGTLRSVMRLIVLVLGRRNEHQRSDRDQYITVYSENVTYPAAFNKYHSGQAFWNLFPYDHCSITHVFPSDFARPGTVSFNLIEPSASIPKTDQLSFTDCRLLSLLYGCDPTKCPQKPHCSPSPSTTSKENVTESSNEHEFSRSTLSVEERTTSGFSATTGTRSSATSSPSQAANTTRSLVANLITSDGMTSTGNSTVTSSTGTSVILATSTSGTIGNFTEAELAVSTGVPTTAPVPVIQNTQFGNAT